MISKVNRVLSIADIKSAVNWSELAGDKIKGFEMPAPVFKKQAEFFKEVSPEIFVSDDAIIFATAKGLVTFMKEEGGYV